MNRIRRRRRKTRNKNILILLISVIGIGLIIFSGNLYYENKLKSITLANSSNIEPVSEVENTTPGDLYIYASNGNIDIFKREKDNKYIGYHIKHFQRGADTDLTASNFNVWKIDVANEYERNNDEFIKTLDIVTTGEWEMAIKEQGASDFIGGNAHGDEITTSIQMLIDGKEVDIYRNIKINNEATELKLIVVSDLYRDSKMTNGLEKIGVHTKTYTFNKVGFIIEQKVEFIDEMKIENGYLAMLPILREANGLQITDTYSINGQDKEYDVSSDKLPILSRVEASKAEIKGSTSKVSATVEILEKGTEIPTMFFVWNAPAYNKLYFAYAQDGYQVKRGDVWSQTTKYDIRVSK